MSDLCRRELVCFVFFGFFWFGLGLIKKNKKKLPIKLFISNIKCLCSFLECFCGIFKVLGEGCVGCLEV